MLFLSNNNEENTNFSLLWKIFPSEGMWRTDWTDAVVLEWSYGEKTELHALCLDPESLLLKLCHTRLSVRRSKCNMVELGGGLLLVWKTSLQVFISVKVNVGKNPVRELHISNIWQPQAFWLSSECLRRRTTCAVRLLLRYVFIVFCWKMNSS